MGRDSTPCTLGLDMHVQTMHYSAMKLSDYLEMASITDAQFAFRIGKERSVVTKYRNGTVKPPLDVISMIHQVTSGAVTFQDFVSAA